MFRARMDELGKLQDAFKIQEDRVRDAQKRLSNVDTRVAQIERELAALDGDLATLLARVAQGDKAALRACLELDRPLPAQLQAYLGHIADGTLGRSCGDPAHPRTVASRRTMLRQR